ncbi:MAG: PepSY-associated TM helix domain-containing protein [Verrucomicrobiota bacterium]
MNLNVLIRRIHLGSAFVLLGFVVMYFVTGLVVTHGAWFGEATEQVVRRTEPFPREFSASPDAAEFTIQLREHLGLRGKPSKVEHRGDGTWRVNYAHPGHVTEVTIPADRSTLSLVEKTQGWQRVMVGLHRLHGYGGGGLYNLWALLVDVTAVSMIVFAVTGLVLWHRMTRDRRLGWGILSAGFVLTASTIAYLMLRR